MGRGFDIMPRCGYPESDAAGLAFAVLMPNGLGLPLRLLTQREAEQLAATLNEYLDTDEE